MRRPRGPGTRARGRDGEIAGAEVFARCPPLRRGERGVASAMLDDVRQLGRPAAGPGGRRKHPCPVTVAATSSSRNFVCIGFPSSQGLQNGARPFEIGAAQRRSTGDGFLPAQGFRVYASRATQSHRMAPTGDDSARGWRPQTQAAPCRVYRPRSPLRRPVTERTSKELAQSLMPSSEAPRARSLVRQASLVLE